MASAGYAAANAAAAEFVSGGDPAVAGLIATGLGLIHVLQVYTSSMVTLAVWDWLVCLKEEYRRVWKREFSLISCLYLWNRYWGLAAFAINLWLFNANISVEACRKLHFLIVPTCMMSTLGAEAILAVRTYAFLGRKPWIGIALVAGLLGELSFLIYVAVRGVHQTPLAIGTSGPCTASDKPGQHVVMGFWLCPVVFDLICTVAILWKALNLRYMGVKSSLMTIFVGEGLLYFLAVAIVNLINAAFMFQSNANIQNINCFLALVLSQVLCCRLVLNLRNALTGYKSTEHGGSTSGAHYAFGPPSAHPTQASGINIPLHQVTVNEDGDHIYGGVKVQVDVDVEGQDGRSKS